MRDIKYSCDSCGKIIDGKAIDNIAGGGTLCVLNYEGSLYHNQVPQNGWHYHYSCFCKVVRAINALNLSAGASE